MDTAAVFDALKAHPIFSSSSANEDVLDASFANFGGSVDTSFSAAALPDLERAQRRSTMCIRESDLVVAVGSEIRMASLTERALGRGYKTLRTPNIRFQIHQIVTSPNGKLLAVAGAHRVAVVVLPSPAYWRTEPSTVDVKMMSIGQYYHGSRAASRIAKVDWHPWGAQGATLLVLTAEGTFREYDVSQDPDEPQQTLSFVPPRPRTAYDADSSTREIVAFTLGSGRSDWGPLTVYSLMKNGDVFAICPYMPKNSSIPPSYLHGLQCFISKKQEMTLEDSCRTELSAVYEQQLRYANALLKQLPADQPFSGRQHGVPIEPPPSTKAAPARQGPFLFRPAPLEIESSPGADATDLVYLGFSSDNDEDLETDSERLYIVLVAFQDGKVDVCIDLDKVEARWESNMSALFDDSPMLTVYESIDLGLLTALNRSQVRDIGNLLKTNYPVFQADPIYTDTVYIYHGFGVHCLFMRQWLAPLGRALVSDKSGPPSQDLAAALSGDSGTDVICILDTFSSVHKTSVPVIAAALPNNVYLPYNLFVLTATMSLVPFELSLRLNVQSGQPARDISGFLIAKDPAYVTALDPQYVPPAIFSRPAGLPAAPRHPLPHSTDSAAELQVNPETLRLLGSTVEKLRAEIQQCFIGLQDAHGRIGLQLQEFKRQQQRCNQIMQAIARLKGDGQLRVKQRLAKVLETELSLMKRLDKAVQSFMDASCPVLSEYEANWFAELGRMKQEVLGHDDGRSLMARAEMLETLLEQLAPDIKAITAEEAKKGSNAQHAELGTSQVLRIGRRIGEQTKMIEGAEAKLKQFASRIGLPLTDA